MLVDVTKEERDVLLRWKKRSDSFVLVRLKAEAVLHASRDVDVSIIAEMVGRSQRAVRNWPASQRLSRLRSVVTGHASNENAAKLTRAQKDQLKKTLSRTPSQSDIKADFWDVPALHDVVKIKFGAECASDSSYQLLMCSPGMSFKFPNPFDKRRDEAAITARMTQIRQEVAELQARGWEVRTVDEVRVEHEAETRRIWLPRGGRTRFHVDRTRSAQPLSISHQNRWLRVQDRRDGAERMGAGWVWHAQEPHTWLCPRLFRTIAPILASPGVFLVRKAHSSGP